VPRGARREAVGESHEVLVWATKGANRGHIHAEVGRATDGAHESSREPFSVMRYREASKEKWSCFVCRVGSKVWLMGSGACHRNSL